MIHLVGIAGAGMSALAEVLLQDGSIVSGSDLVDSDTTRRLRGRGAKVDRGHRAEQVPVGAALVVYSPAVRLDNVELAAAERLGIERLSYPQMLGRLMRQGRGVAVAGTHGKTTTTAMVGWTLLQAGCDPTVLVGGMVPQLGGSGRHGRGDLVVAESCEFERGFHQLRPRAAAILNIEPDHPDCYPGLTDLVDSFATFAERVPPGGLVVARGDSRAVRAAVGRWGGPVETFSTTTPGHTWWATDFRSERGRVRFRVFYQGLFFAELRLELLGVHNVANALAAMALCHWAGAGRQAIKESLEEFRGVERRCQFKGTWRGVSLVDDYAHHPTAIRATLRACREYFGRRRLWCVFQPHQHLRTRALLKDFARAFGDADKIIVPDIYGVRESPQDRQAIHARRLVEEIEQAGGAVRYLGGFAEIVSYLEAHLEPGDVLVTMGAGTIGSIADEFTRRRPGNRQAG